MGRQHGCLVALRFGSRSYAECWGIELRPTRRRGNTAGTLLCDLVMPRIVDGSAPKRSEVFAPIYIVLLFNRLRRSAPSLN